MPAHAQLGCLKKIHKKSILDATRQLGCVITMPGGTLGFLNIPLTVTGVLLYNVKLMSIVLI